ncbi:hypothetical protein SAMN04489798_4740 [Pseudomonas arsenicoxydans]|uniref:Uncharacterized protein n=1 Tax=Pseudomonas arsenicoxydans TaxID=702115 RepID=A0A1H0Q2Y7_9PSED|nr:pyocin S6 family toxin immunity protein [Pseudomonas arsenicoxydans]SDP11460.1 hypothetical protein SAMN04489798_4740 [Pseudomonas arsenicoxydans]
MFLWISGFLKGDDAGDFLKFEHTVRPECESAILDVFGWKSLDEAADDEWHLTSEQAQKIAAVLNQPLPTELELFIGVRDSILLKSNSLSG